MSEIPAELAELKESWGLNDEEKFALDKASRGLTYDEAAEATFFSAHTIKYRRESVIAKSGTTTMAAAIRQAFEVGLLSVDPNAEALQGALTPAELLNLDMIAEGFTVTEAAEQLRRSPETIKIHRRNICKKLPAENKLHCIRRAYETGLFKLPDARDIEPIIDQVRRLPVADLNRLLARLAIR